ncbi:MAG: GNAT family N-acetyltransferase, partial [Verrucomicrobiota bacterium]
KKMEVKIYDDKDYEGILSIFESNTPEYFGVDEKPWLIETLEGPDGPLFSVLIDGKIVGFGGYEVSKYYNWGILVWGMVRSELHGQGIGKHLLVERIKHFKENHSETRYLKVDTSPCIEGFYTKMGFTVLKNWKSGYRSGFDRVDLYLDLEA